MSLLVPLKFDFLNVINSTQTSTKLERTFDWTQGDCLLLSVSLLRLSANTHSPIGNGKVAAVCSSDKAQHFTFAFSYNDQDYTLCGYGLLRGAEVLDRVRSDMFGASNALSLSQIDIDNAMYLAHLSEIEPPTLDEVRSVQSLIKDLLQSDSSYRLVPIDDPGEYSSAFNDAGIQGIPESKVVSGDRVSGILDKQGNFYSNWELLIADDGQRELSGGSRGR